MVETARRSRPPTVAIFAATSLTVGLSVGFGLGVWLLLNRVWGLSLFGANWLALVQIHGRLQLFGFAGLFAMGIALHALPRFRAAPPPRTVFVWITYLGTVGGLALVSIAQPLLELPARGPLLVLGGALLCIGTLSFAYAAGRALLSGGNPHRPDEFLIGAGICAIPIAAFLVAVGVVGTRSAVVELDIDDRAGWMMLIGGLSTLIFGVWTRLAPGFVAATPAKRRLLLSGAVLWIVGVFAQALGVPLGPWLLLIGAAAMTSTMGVFGAGIAHQSLQGHARLTRIGVRSAFVWLFIGLTIVAAATVGLASSYLQVSAGRHALALGFVTLMIYAVASRALPAFLGRRLWSHRLQAATLVVANVAVVLRVGPQLYGGIDGASNVIVGVSGLLAYTALVLFTVNVMRTLRGPSAQATVAGAPVPLEIRFSRGPSRVGTSGPAK